MVVFGEFERVTLSIVGRMIEFLFIMVIGHGLQSLPITNSHMFHNLFITILLHNASLITIIFLVFEVMQILQLPLTTSHQMDCLIWSPHKKSMFSIKITYHSIRYWEEFQSLSVLVEALEYSHHLQHM